MHILLINGGHGREGVWSSTNDIFRAFHGFQWMLQGHKKVKYVHKIKYRVFHDFRE